MRKSGSLAVMALFLLHPNLVPGVSPVAGAAGEPVRVSITIKQRKADQKLVRVKQGDSVELTFLGDEPAELHLHGYDKLLRLEPPAPAILRIEAALAGRFSIEAHDFGGKSSGSRQKSHAVLLYLEVYPR